MKTYEYGGEGFGSWAPDMRPEEIKTCPACLLRTNSFKKRCPRCFTNLDTGELWPDPKSPPDNMTESYCTRCGSGNVGSEGVLVVNPPPRMGRQWCRTCIIEVENGAPQRLFVPRKCAPTTDMAWDPEKDHWGANVALGVTMAGVLFAIAAFWNSGGWWRLALVSAGVLFLAGVIENLRTGKPIRMASHTDEKKAIEAIASTARQTASNGKQ